MVSPKRAGGPFSSVEFNEIKSLLFEIRNEIKQMSAGTEKDLLTPAEVCRTLKIGRTTYQRYVAQGILVQVQLRPGKGKVYIRRGDLQALIDRGML